MLPIGSGPGNEVEVVFDAGASVDPEKISFAGMEKSGCSAVSCVKQESNRCN